MSLVLALSSIALLVCGAIVLIVTLAATSARDKAIKTRVDLVATRLAISADTSRDKPAGPVATAPARSILGYGAPRSWPSTIGTPALVTAAVAGATVTAFTLLVWLETPVWVAMLGAALGAFPVPQALLRMEQARQEKKFVDVLPDGIDMIVRMIRAGLPMGAAVRIVGQEASSPVKEVFADVADQMGVGVAFDHALVAAGKKIKSEDFRFFTVASALQQSTGGNLAATLESLSIIVRKRRAGRMKAKAVTAEARMSSYVLGSIPFFIIGALILIDPAYLAPLITDPRGNVIVAMALGSLSMGFFVMYSLMRGVTKV
jgi:tight adherence protein B